jgi:hypothetical protein
MLGEANGIAFDFTDNTYTLKVASVPTYGVGTAFLTTTRAGVANEFNSSGLLASFAIDAPRICYNPATLVPRGLLMEPTKTNLAVRSNAFSTSWVLLNATVNQNATGIDGATSAWTITDDTANGTHQASQFIAVATLPSATVTAFSVYVKAGTNNFVSLRMYDGGTATNYAAAVFNLATGAMTQSSVGAASGTITATTVRNIGNGVYRIGLVAACAAVTGTTFAVGHAPAASGNTFNTFGAINHVSNGKTLVIQRAQIEAATTQSNHPTSYIETAAAAVARVADSVTFLLSTIPSVATAHTIMAEIEMEYADTTSSRALVCLNNGTNDRSQVGLNASGLGTGTVQSASATQAAIAAGPAVLANTYKRIASGAIANSFNTASDGVLGTLDTAGNMPVGMLNCRLNGISTTSATTIGYLRKALILPRRMTDAELTALSLVV